MLRLLAAVLVTLLALPALSITFDDGQIHVIDAANSFPLEVVTVEDAATGGATTVRLIDGGQVVAINARGSSVVEMTGGFAGGGGANVGVTMDDSSHLHMSGGFAERILYRSSATSEFSGTATVGGSASSTIGAIHVTAGVLNITGGINPDGSKVVGGTVNIMGGEMGGWNVLTGGTLLISGGVSRIVTAFDGGTLEVTGGTVYLAAGGGISGGSGILSISGGDIEYVYSGLSGSVSLSGGSISITNPEVGPPENLVARGEGSIEVFGTGFNFQFGNIVPTAGTLTGTLADGTPLNVNFARASTATIRLVPAVPALSPLALSVLAAALIGGMVGFLIRQRR